MLPSANSKRHSVLPRVQSDPTLTNAETAVEVDVSSKMIRRSHLPALFALSDYRIAFTSEVWIDIISLC